MARLGKAEQGRAPHGSAGPATPAPTLADLHQALVEAEHEFELAKFIDSYPRMVRERDAAAKRITKLRGQIAALEATDNRAPGEAWSMS